MNGVLKLRFISLSISCANLSGYKAKLFLSLYPKTPYFVQKYFFKGKEPACRVIDDDSGEDFGNLPADLVSDLAWKYPKTRWEAKINSLDDFWPEDKDKEIHLCKLDLFIFKDTGGNEIF